MIVHVGIRQTSSICFVSTKICKETETRFLSDVFILCRGQGLVRFRMNSKPDSNELPVSHSTGRDRAMSRLGEHGTGLVFLRLA